MARSFLLVAGAIMVPATASAHPKLLRSVPAEGAVAAAPKSITLEFSEKLIQRFSGVDLTRTATPETTASKVKGLRTAFGPDGKTLIATPAKALTSGSYRVDWHAVAGDTHRITGTVAFTVR